MAAIETLPLSAAPEAVPILARWFAAEWADHYAGLTAAEVEAKFPVTGDWPWIVVARRGGDLVGSAALRRGSIHSHAHLTPWLGGLFTAPEHRRKGAARALLAAVAAEAALRGFDTLYTGTVEAHALFEALGWKRIAETDQEGQAVTVYERRVG